MHESNSYSAGLAVVLKNTVEGRLVSAGCSAYALVLAGELAAFLPLAAVLGFAAFLVLGALGTFFTAALGLVTLGLAAALAGMLEVGSCRSKATWMAGQHPSAVISTTEPPSPHTHSHPHANQHVS